MIEVISASFFTKSRWKQDNLLEMYGFYDLSITYLTKKIFQISQDKIVIAWFNGDKKTSELIFLR